VYEEDRTQNYEEHSICPLHHSPCHILSVNCNKTHKSESRLGYEIKYDLYIRKLSYRIDDRPIYGCSENFRESLNTPTTTFAEILMGFCSNGPCECTCQI